MNNDIYWPGLVCFVSLVIWNLWLTVAWARSINLIHRLDAVLANALDALGFKKDGGP